MLHGHDIRRRVYHRDEFGDTSLKANTALLSMAAQRNELLFNFGTHLIPMNLWILYLEITDFETIQLKQQSVS